MTTLDTTTAASDPGEMPEFLKRETAEKRRHWRDLIPVHQACAAFPDLSHDELLALGQDIKVNGLLSPIVIVTQEAPKPKYSMLDGKNRTAAMELSDINFELGLGDEGRPFLKMPEGNLKPDDLQTLVVVGPFTDDEANAHAIALNAHRRHLDAKAKREAIESLLKLDPTKSDRQIAKAIDSTPTTVGKVRKKAEARGGVSRVDTRKDTKGRAQPAKKAKRGRPPKVAKAAPPTPAAVAVASDHVDHPPKPAAEDAFDVVCGEWARSPIKQLFLDLSSEHRAAFCEFISGGVM